jgi:hypothetical protein
VEDYAHIPLHGKHSQGRTTRVSREDYAWLASRRWRLDREGGYVLGCHNGTVEYLHRLITNAPRGKQVDHINGDTLDNRRSNLRVCSHMENQRNQHAVRGASVYKGVSKHRTKWQAQIRVNKKCIRLGCFATQQEAAVAYDDAARTHFGEFAKTNF